MSNDKTSNYGIPFLCVIIFCTIGLFTIVYGLVAGVVGVIVGLLVAILIVLERILNILNREYKSKN